MAYRRSISTRAKLLYQQQRFAPSFSHVHSDDEDNNGVGKFNFYHRKSDRNSHSAASATLGLYQRSLFGASRFSSSARFAAPTAHGSAFVRNMSTTGVGDAAGKVDVITDVASDMFVDSTVETVAAQASPVVSEVAVAAADSFFPVAALQYVIDYVHTFTGLEWWASIAATTILIRFLTVPLMVNQLKATSKFTLLRPRLEEVKKEMNDRGMSPTAVAEGQTKMQALFKEYGVTPFTPLKGLFIQGPVFMSFFFAVTNMAEKVPSFKQGGAFWFVDLTTPDDMYMLPVLTALTFWITVECNMQEGMEGNPAARTIKNVSRVFAALTIPLTASFPKAIFCYWITANVFSLMYGMVIKRPGVKKFLNIPIIPVTPASSDQTPGFNFFDAVKKYSAAQAKAQVQARIEAQKPTPTPASPMEASKSVNQKISSSSVLSQRLKSLEKEVKGRKKNKKR